MLYQALEVPLPQFAHCSLLVDENRQKLSKRSGTTSVRQYRDKGYLPEALTNYLYLLGQAHPEEKDIFSLEEAIHHFKLEKLHKAPAFYDLEKLKFINGKHLRELSNAELLEHCQHWINSEHPFHAQDRQWRERCLLTFVDKINLPANLSPISTLSSTKVPRQTRNSPKFKRFYPGKVPLKSPAMCKVKWKN